MDPASRDQHHDQPSDQPGSATDASDGPAGVDSRRSDAGPRPGATPEPAGPGGGGRRRNRRRTSSDSLPSAGSGPRRDRERKAPPATEAPGRVPQQRPASPPGRSTTAPSDAGTRPQPTRGAERRGATESRPRRTPGTRPPDPGNGRGLSGSQRTPNAHGEVPIRPDNRTFDDQLDRQVCIARSYIIPEEFPVLFRRLTAARRLAVVATTGTELLYCDLAHTGPHVWPDQTVVTAGIETGGGVARPRD